jgi:hypothetical protein
MEEKGGGGVEIWVKILGWKIKIIPQAQHQQHKIDRLVVWERPADQTKISATPKIIFGVEEVILGIRGLEMKTATTTEILGLGIIISQPVGALGEEILTQEEGMRIFREIRARGIQIILLAELEARMEITTTITGTNMIIMMMTEKMVRRRIIMRKTIRMVTGIEKGMESMMIGVEVKQVRGMAKVVRGVKVDMEIGGTMLIWNIWINRMRRRKIPTFLGLGIGKIQGTKVKWIRKVENKEKGLGVREVGTGKEERISEAEIWLRGGGEEAEEEVVEGMEETGTEEIAREPGIRLQGEERRQRRKRRRGRK